MSRPPLILGTWGRIKRQTTDAGGVARARFRDYDGVTRQVERTGKTEAAAERALLKALRDRARLPSEDLTPETRLDRLIEEWDKRLDHRKLADSTRETYRARMKHVHRAMGALQLREITVPAVDRFLAKVSKTSGPGSARLTRVVLADACQLAVRKGAMATNPVRDADTIPQTAKPVRTLDVAGVLDARRSLREWDAGIDGRGIDRATDMADPTDMVIATGARTGEVLALRWIDILDLDGDNTMVKISGTVLTRDGKLRRQDNPKTEHSYRELFLPPFAVRMLRRRRDAGHGCPWVFPSSTDTLRSPNNFRRQWRQWREASELEDWITPKTFRKAVATLLATERDDNTAGDQLGHVHGSAVTRKHYIQRAYQGPDVRDLLETFAA